MGMRLKNLVFVTNVFLKIEAFFFIFMVFSISLKNITYSLIESYKFKTFKTIQ